MKKAVIIFICLAVLLQAACTQDGEPRISYSAAPEASAQAMPTPVPTRVATTRPDVTPEAGETQSAPADTPTPKDTGQRQQQTPDTAGEGTIRVRDGDTLERDIIPQLKKAFSLTEKQIKDALADAKSDIIGKAQGFRRMEGVIVPGTYGLDGKSLEHWVVEWINGAEQRYDSIAAGVSEKNNLSAAHRVILASVVEGDTNLADAYENEVATVFLNRIKKNDTFGSCPTVEYALGYQRPYLKTEDTKADSKYNTYKRRGLPPGPICCFDDESLRASIRKPFDSKLYFFFYDYVKDEIMSFKSIDDFRAASKESKALFEATYTISRFEKMDDKRDFFN